MLEEKPSFLKRLAHGWNAFREKDQTAMIRRDLGPGYLYRPDRIPLRVGTERSIVAAIITRIGIDVASLTFKHAQLDADGRYCEDRDSGLNYCLTTEANLDQSSRAFIQDLVENMCDEGVVAVMPEATDLSPLATAGFDIKSMRVGKIVEWFPDSVKLKVYDVRDGHKKEIILPKRFVTIIQNPLYDVMNEPNSTLKRLTHKLNLLDVIDEKTSSGKLDLIIHLPYGAKTDVQRQSIKRRRREIESQLENSKYGIIYTDASEKITQLNRPIENHLMEQIEYLTSMLYSQLGMTKEVLEGTADEKTMLNYYSRTIEPIASAICDEMNRKFLSKTARSQNQKVVFFRDLIKLAPLDSIINAGRDFTSSEIMTPNEVRQWIGLKPASDPNADEFRNRYINASPGTEGEPPAAEETVPDNIIDISQKKVSSIPGSNPRGNLASVKVSDI